MGAPIVVIGGGIVGTSIAYELQSKGAPTLLVERDLDPQGASAFSFASLSAFDEPQRDFYLLKTHGLIAWRAWLKEFGEELGVQFNGELRWAESHLAAAELEALLRRARRRGYSVRTASLAELKEREPALSVERAATVTFAQDDGVAEPLRAIDLLRQAFDDRGGQLLIGRAGLVIGDDDVSVRVGEDRVDASTVVIATGAETAILLERFGWDIPMDPSPGLLVVTQPLEPFLKGAVYGYPETGVPVHLRQFSDGRVVIGERTQHTIAKNPTLEHAHTLLHQARHWFPILKDAEIDRFTVEWRPMPRDGMPIVGHLPGLPSVYVAATHSGVTVAPALARFVASELNDGEPDDRLKPFTPARFGAHQAEAFRNIEEAFGGSEVYLG
ncbi:MAG TPA: FAD-binding oxidoreductase [Candidatus Eisenbacteria bacterium]|nr:FAD-binding oxidoreductase [Candidatus Eisenbacteria bacterium]